MLMANPPPKQYSTAAHTWMTEWRSDHCGCLQLPAGIYNHNFLSLLFRAVGLRRLECHLIFDWLLWEKWAAQGKKTYFCINSVSARGSQKLEPISIFMPISSRAGQLTIGCVLTLFMFLLKHKRRRRAGNISYAIWVRSLSFSTLQTVSGIKEYFCLTAEY